MNKKAIFSIMISVVLVWFLLSHIDVREIVTTLKDVPLHLVLIGFLFYTFSYILRSLRFSVLLQKNVGLWTLFNIVAVHTMWTNILPLRSGELSYLYLLKKKGGAGSYLTGVPSLILARVFDLVAISAIFIFSLIGVGTLPGVLSKLALVLIVLITAVLIFLVFLIWKRERFLSRLKDFIIRFGLNRFSIIEKMTGKGNEVLRGFDAAESWRNASKVFILSLFSWLFIFISNFIMWRAVGLELTIWHALFLNPFFVFIGLFPVHGWAGFGTMEAVWVLTVMLFDVSKETGIITGFQLHAFGLLFTIILGLTGLILSSYMNSKQVYRGTYEK